VNECPSSFTCLNGATVSQFHGGDVGDGIDLTGNITYCLRFNSKTALVGNPVQNCDFRDPDVNTVAGFSQYFPRGGTMTVRAFSLAPYSFAVLVRSRGTDTAMLRRNCFHKRRCARKRDQELEGNFRFAVRRACVDGLRQSGFECKLCSEHALCLRHVDDSFSAEIRRLRW
jgi:hypothetical protein